MAFVDLVKGFWKKNGDDATVPAPVAPHRPPTALEERQQLLSHHVRLVARGMSNGLAVYGSRGGLGKTRVILQTLEAEGVEPVILTGHCTPLAMYLALYEHPESVVFLDDCDAMFRNLVSLGILRSALWEGDKGHRLVSYSSSQLKVPSSFYFKGRVIFAINTLPMKNAAFQAVLSRVDQYELSASNSEVLDLMRELAAEGFEGKLTADECQEVVDYIAEFSATRELSLRLLEPSYRKVIYAHEAGMDWRELVASQLYEIGRTAAPKPSDARNYDLECLKQVVEDYPHSVAEQEAAFCTLTRRSRATFFRLKKSATMTDSVVSGAVAACDLGLSTSTAIELPSNSQDTSNEVCA